jgi:hypothetical protein
VLTSTSVAAGLAEVVDGQAQHRVLPLLEQFVKWSLCFIV